MADDTIESGSGETDALLSRLRLIEDQPLEARAEAFVQIHDGLRSTLEGADSPTGGTPTANTPPQAG